MGLIVLYKEKQDGGWEKEMYLADTQGIEREIGRQGMEIGRIFRLGHQSRPGKPPS